jgi:hypothetical protein
MSVDVSSSSITYLHRSPSLSLEAVIISSFPNIPHCAKDFFCSQESGMELEIKLCRINWTPSFSRGRLLVLMGRLKENQTARGRLQWKKDGRHLPQHRRWSSVCRCELNTWLHGLQWQELAL